MFDRIDLHPERRGPQIDWARAELRGRPEPDHLRTACAVLLTLSDDPYDRTLATELLRCVEQVPSDGFRADGRPCGGERSVAQARDRIEADETRRSDPLSRIAAAAGSR